MEITRKTLITAVQEGMKTYEEVRHIQGVYPIEWYIKEAVIEHLTSKFIECSGAEHQENLSLVMRIWRNIVE